MAMTTIATEELESLLELVATQDARIASLEARNDYLERLHILKTEGPDELQRRFNGVSPDQPCRPGYYRGGAGQEILGDREMIYEMLRRQRRGEHDPDGRSGVRLPHAVRMKV